MRPAPAKSTSLSGLDVEDNDITHLCVWVSVCVCVCVFVCVYLCVCGCANAYCLRVCSTVCDILFSLACFTGFIFHVPLVASSIFNGGHIWTLQIVATSNYFI